MAFRCENGTVSSGVGRGDPAGDRLRVLISASAGELAPEREAADAAVRTLRLTPITSEPGAETQQVGSDVFVGIYWESYGWISPGARRSSLEDEYRRCAERPRLVYVKEPAPERDADLERLIDRMRAGGPIVCRDFATPGELAELLIDDLAALLSSRFHSPQPALRELPEGLVSFMFVDIDGSTPIVQLLGEDYPDLVLDPFRKIVAGAVEGDGDGVVVHFDGDGAFCVFQRPDRAATAAVAIHRHAAAREWPNDLSIRARIGVHSGAAQRTPDNYVGLEVHRAARIGAAANGGQILVSSSTAEMLEGSLPDGWALDSLGSFALKGLGRAEPLLQLTAPGLDPDVPNPRARGASSIRLPMEPTELIGRDEEVARIVSRLDHDEARLVTLTGPGGIGKTRLGIAAAAAAANAYPDGVFFVALADVTKPDQITSAIAEVLGVRAEGSRALLDSISDRLATDRILLVLDNFEQVIEGRAVVAALLAGAPGTDVIVTSRVALRLRSEHELPVAPLSAPDAERLFVDRANAARPTWSFSEREQKDIGEICRRLDGLPLAIELAAARLRVLDTADLLDRLTGRLDVLGSAADLPDRQQTLGATIGWSHDLLGEDERVLFRRLALFVGGWTPEAAEAVCGEGITDVVGTLEHLVENSLVTTYLGACGRRMRMLETIRRYALERLEESGELEDIHRRHADYFDGFVHALHPLFDTPRASEAMQGLDEDWENIIAAVVPYRRAQGDFTSLVAIASSTWRYVWLYDHVREATAWMADAYEARADLSPACRGELCRIWSSALYQLGEYERARDVLDEAVAILAETGPRDREAWARTILAGLLPYFEEDLTRTLLELGRATAVFRQEGNDFGLATALAISGSLALALGETEGGAVQLGEGLEASKRVGLPSLIGANRALLALALLALGRIDEAREHLERAARTPLYLEGTAYCLEGLAALALAEGDPVRASAALGAAEALRERTGIHMWPVFRMAYEPAIASLDAAGPEAQAARYEGRLMAPREALKQLARPLAIA